MKSFFTTILLCSSLVSAVAQVPLVLSQSNYSFTTPQELHVITADTAGVAVPQQGADVTWDFSGLVEISFFDYTYIANTDANFPNTALIDTNIFRTVALGKGYYYNSVLVFDANGFYEDGIIINEQKYGLGNVTGTATDSFNIPAQSIAYPSPRYIVDFPATENSTWESSFNYDVHVDITAAVFGLNDTDFVQRTYYTQEDTVVGWGEAIMPATGGPSIPYEALMVQRRTVTVDSFFFASTPVDSTLLSTFGLAQGQQRSSYRHLFFRAGNPYMLLILNYGTDATYSQIQGIFYDGNNLALQTGIQNIADNGSVQVYPNPVIGNTLNFSFDDMPQTMEGAVSIYNAVGERVYSQKMNGGTNLQITLPELSSGVYLYRIENHTGQSLGSGRFVK